MKFYFVTQATFQGLLFFCFVVGFFPDYLTFILVYIGDVQFSGRNFLVSAYKMTCASDSYLFPSVNTSFS